MRANVDSDHRLRITSIGIAVVGQHIAGGVGTGRAVADATSFDRIAAVIGWYGRVIRTMDRDGDGRGRRCSCSIDHRVSEGFCQGIGRESQRLDRGVVVVDVVDVGTIALKDERTVAAGNGAPRCRWSATEIVADHLLHRLGFAVGNRIDIGVVGKHIAGRVDSGRSIGDSTRFGRIDRIVDSDRVVVLTLNRQGDLRGAGGTAASVMV